MENNEIMNYEDIEVMDEAIVSDGGSSLGTGAAMLIGAGLAAAVGAGVMLVKKGIKAWKNKKEAANKHDFIEAGPESKQVKEDVAAE